MVALLQSTTTAQAGSASFASNTTPGSLIAVCISQGSGGETNGVTDDAGNTYTAAVLNINDTAWWTAEIWICPNSLQLNAGDQIYFSTRHDSKGVVLEFDLEDASFNVVGTTGTKEMTSGSDTTVTADGTAPPDALAVAMMGAENLTPSDVSAGWTIGDVDTDGTKVMAAYRVIPATETPQVTFTTSGSGDGGGSIAALELTGGAPPAPSEVAPPVGLQVI